MIDADDEGQWVTDLDGLGDAAVDRLADVDPHRCSGHGSRRSQRCRGERTEMQNNIMHFLID